MDESNVRISLGVTADMTPVGITSSPLDCKRQHWHSAREIVIPVQPVPLLILAQHLRVFTEEKGSLLK